MQLDGALFAIERRTTGGCIDLAIVFFREHLSTLMGLTGVFAFPSCVIAWALATYTEDGGWYSAAVFLSLSPFLGGSIAAGCGHRVFGDTLSISGSLAKMSKRIIPLIFYALLVRLLGFVSFWLLLVPGLFIANRYGFMPELLYLEQLKRKQAGKRVKTLLRSYFADVIGRMSWILYFYIVCVIILFTIADAVGTLLLGCPIFVRRITGEGFGWWQEMMDMLYTDPLIVVVLHACLWLAYPICRLAWLFCYLDLRIRREGWDIDLDSRIEARRLEAALG